MMELDCDSRARISAAANWLYQVTEETEFPNVDAVGKLARVSMPHACAGLMDWWRGNHPADDGVELVIAHLAAAYENLAQELLVKDTELARLQLEIAERRKEQGCAKQRD